MSVEILLLVLALVMLAHPCMADVFNDAEWIRDPIFWGTSIVDFYHKESTSPPKPAGPQNIHTYFRKEFDLPCSPLTARLIITGDDYVKLYANGEAAFQGPAPAYPFAHPYYETEIAEHLRAGRNCLAAHLYYQGLRNRVWNSADNRSGFIAKLDITCEDGSRHTLATDSSWRCLQSKAFVSNRSTGYQTQFLEDIDMREIPFGWRDTGFDDSQWTQPLTGRQDHTFVRSMTPPIQCCRAVPARAKETGQGRYFFDFGSEVVGCTRAHIQGPAGHRIEIRHGEELDGAETVRYALRANCVYQEYATLSGGDDIIELFDYKGFRYIEILNAPSDPEVWVEVRHHPFDPDLCIFQCSDSLLNAIWELCKNGVRFGAQGVFVDCPTREKGQYLGDTFIAARSHLLLTGDPSLTRKSLQDFQHSQRICPGMMAVAPGSFMQEIAEYSLLWPLLLRTYYQQTGDRYFAQQMAGEAFEKLFAYFEAYETPEGLLSGVTEKWVLVDWPKNLRDSFDYDYAKTRENAVLNAFYYASLRAASELCHEMGMDARPYERRAERVLAAFHERLFDPAARLYRDAPGSDHHSLHANALPLALGLVPEAYRNDILEFIRLKRLSCGVYIAPFVIEACYDAGAPELGYSLLRSTDERSWGEMLKHGATTCMEAWGPDQKWNTSWCHPWSSSPVFLIIEQVMGLTPSKPGWRAVRFAPNMPDSLEHAEVSIPIPFGKVTVRYNKGTGYQVDAPPGVPVEAVLPPGTEVAINHTIDNALRRLSEQESRLLGEHHWDQWVGDSAGIWVSVDEQIFRIVQAGRVLWEKPCSTAAQGTGSVVNSNRTPLGWHSIHSKVGDGEPWGRIFRAGKPTKELWKPGDKTSDDLVLTRVLFLAGEEPGKNKGGDVDTYRRHIYIHGTNGEDAIGTPASHGCIRLRNSDAITAFERVNAGAYVLITQTR